MRAIAVSMFFAMLLVAQAFVHTPGSDETAEDWREGVVQSVSGAEIMSTVEDLQAFGTRDFHTEAALEAAEYVFDRMGSLGISTTFQEFMVGDVASVNVVGTLNQDADGLEAFVIGAHYDSENRFATNQSEAENYTAPGADDNASGVGAMLEIARVLAEESDFAAPVTFVAFGAEELGFDASGGTAGSAYFADVLSREGVNISGAFIMDMIGFSVESDEVATVVSDGSSDQLYSSLANATATYDIDLDLRFVMNPLIRFSDHRSFWDNGYLSVLIIEEIEAETLNPVNPYYHTSDDTAAELSVGQMAAVSKMLLGALLDLTSQGEDSYAKSNVAAIVFASIVMVVVASAIAIRLRRRRGVS
ncbi:MAG: M20/M25/M40 family metallo-hydrolase [Methanobacteriota archaeon]|nr:MAG: M20/M25/M40 family metallo-hydrolase [Euryarchaeota archaeon]